MYTFEEGVSSPRDIMDRTYPHNQLAKALRVDRILKVISVPLSKWQMICDFHPMPLNFIVSVHIRSILTYARAQHKHLQIDRIKPRESDTHRNMI